MSASHGRIWSVDGSGDVVVIGVRARPAGAWSTAPLLTGRLIDRDGHRRRRGPMALTAGPRVRSRPRHLGTAVAGLAAAMVIVGVGLFVGNAEVATRAAGSAMGSQPGQPAALPSAPTMEFVYPILPVPAVMPQVPADPGLLYPGPGSVGSDRAIPVVPGPVRPAPAPAPAPVPGPPPPGPVAPPAITSPPPGLGLGAGDRGRGAEGSGGSGAEQTLGRPTTPVATTVPKTTQPTQTQTQTQTPRPPTPPRVLAPVAATLRLDRGPEPLLPVPGADLPEVLAGSGLGLWSEGTGDPAVLVVGADHPALADLLTLGPTDTRWVAVDRGDGTSPLYRLAPPTSYARDAAVTLLSTTDAPLVLLLGMDGEKLILMEAR